MKTIFLFSLLLSINAFGQWTNPYACDPSRTNDCWITCFNSDAVHGADLMVRVFITPIKNGRAEFLIQKESLFWGMKTEASGQVVRDDNNPLNIRLNIGQSSLNVSTKKDSILVNNKWTLSGRSKIAGASRNMICSYNTKMGLIEYDFEYTPDFPMEFFRKYYGLN